MRELGTMSPDEKQTIGPVATITGFANCLHAITSLFCMGGMAWTGISTPRSPLAIIMESVALIILTIFFRACLFSILEMIPISFLINFLASKIMNQLYKV